MVQAGNKELLEARLGIKLPNAVISFIWGFRMFLAGGQLDFKLRDNTKSKANRVKAFLRYMAQGSLALQTCLFLDNVDWIQMWPGDSPKSIFTGIRKVVHLCLNMLSKMFGLNASCNFKGSKTFEIL